MGKFADKKVKKSETVETTKTVEKASAPCADDYSTAKEVGKAVGWSLIGAAICVVAPKAYEALWGDNS